jgi:hypothetical protein
MEKIEKYQLLLSFTIISIVILLSSLIFASKMPKNDNITVTGSASKIVKSDSASITVYIDSRGGSRKEAYNKIKTQMPVVFEYLSSKGIDKKDIQCKAMNGHYTYKQNANGYVTDEVSGYNASQYIVVKSKDVEKIKEIANDIQNLVNKGINIEVEQPEYYYSDLSSIKINLLKEATKDAKQRAKSMLQATGSRVGKVSSVKMGVFQITPPDSTSVSDTGENDTSTIDKKVTAVANVVFKVK